MNTEKIKSMVDYGVRVYWGNPNYEVIKDRIGQYLIHSKFNDHYIGLTWADGVTLNGKEDEFYIEEVV